MRFSSLVFAGHLLRRVGNELLRHASLKGVWIDVGAHYGEVTLGYALSNPALVVYAFEPNLHAASAVFGRAQNYIVLPMAVAEQDGAAEFHVNAFDASSSLLPMRPDAVQSWVGGEALKEERKVTVPTIRLDTFMTLTGIEKVDFLKVDAQGMDLSVVKSAGSRLRDIAKVTLEVSVGPEPLYAGESSKDDVLEFLGSAGFHLIDAKKQSYNQEENLTFVRR